MFGKKRASAPTEKAPKAKKPIYKRIWFWVLVLGVVGMAMGGGSEEGTTAEQPDQSQTETVSASPDTKEEAEAKDTAIYSAVLSAETKFNGLVNLMDSGNLLGIYDGCKETHDFAQDCWDRINDQKDDLNEDYVDAAKMYCVQIQIICENLEDYINDQDMEDLSKAKEGIEYLNGCILDVVTQRQMYLTEVGFTTEEIEEINSAYSAE